MFQITKQKYSLSLQAVLAGLKVDYFLHAEKARILVPDSVLLMGRETMAREKHLFLINGWFLQEKRELMSRDSTEWYIW